MIKVNKKETVEWREGMTVQDVLDIMGYIYPQITVTVNDRLVQREDYHTHEIPDGADVNVFHLAHGG